MNVLLLNVVLQNSMESNNSFQQIIISRLISKQTLSEANYCVLMHCGIKQRCKMLSGLVKPSYIAISQTACAVPLISPDSKYTSHDVRIQC